MRDYQLVTPSLEGVLRHGSLDYEGLHRPTEIMQILDGPASKGRSTKDKSAVSVSSHDRQVLEQYFYDLYGIFMKRLSQFAVATEVANDDPLKMMAMLQEMFKVKELMNKK